MISICCMMNQFRKWNGNIRIIIVFVLLAAFISTCFALNIRTFCVQYNADCSVWLFPLGIAMDNRRTWIMLLPIALFCDAPFLDEHQPFQLIRIGRTRWAVGQILYILVASAIFVVGCYGITALLLFPHLDYSLEWGPVVNTLAQDQISYAFGMDAISKTIIMRYTALQAAVLCGFATWLTTAFLGLFLYFCNLCVRREVGILLTGCFVGVSHYIDRIAFSYPEFYRLRFFSPVSWTDIENIGRGTTSSPTWEYVFVLGIFYLIALTVGILFFAKRKAIETIYID